MKIVIWTKSPPKITAIEEVIKNCPYLNSQKIEIEKKFNLSENDYKIIKEKCNFIKEVKLKDYYLDKDFILTKNNYYLRLRNGVYELKISSFNTETKLVKSEEYDDEEIINQKIKKFNLSIDDLEWIIFVNTKRQKFNYDFKWYNINIDVEEYQYWTRYELELISDESEDKLNNILEDFIKHLWLEAFNDINSSKIITTAMHQNIEMYEILTNSSIK